jgi:sulfur carrier protein
MMYSSGIRFTRRGGVAMQIKINAETNEFPENATITEILSLMSLQGETVIVMLNGEMARSETWNNARVNPGDQLEIIRVIGGG